MNNLEQIVAQYYTDYDGNPMSYHIIRNFQISPNNYQIQLDGVYDKHKGVEVIEPSGLFRVYNHDELSENRYYVRADGNVFFDKSMAGKIVKVDYYSIGLPCIGAGRIYTLLDDKGNVIETLQDILQAGQTVIESLKTFGDVKIVIDEIKTSQYQALKCRQNLDEGIDDATALLNRLNAIDFVQKNQFTQMVGNFNEKVKELYGAIDKNKTLTDGAFTEVKGSISDLNEVVSNNKKFTDGAFTDVKKNISDFKDSVDKTSLFNYISNPIFNTGDYRNWELWDSTTSYSVQPDTSLSHNYSLKLQCKKKSQGITQTIKGLQYGKTYTFKAKLKVEEGTPGLMVRNDNQWNGSLFKVEQGYNQWVEVSLTFMAREGTMPVYIGNVSTDTISTFWVSEVMLYEGDLDIPFIDNLKEIYSRTFQLDAEGMVFGDGNGTYSHTTSDGDLNYVTEGIYNKYVALKYIATFSIPAGNPGTVNVKLPKEFTKRKNSLIWGVMPKGYYYNTYYNFFPFHVAINASGDAYEQDGFMVCPVEGYCRIQNGNDESDVQNQPINGMLIAFA
ncbi:MAG: carbohydrate binding domain-containing protein [Clostridium chrysemydis]|uniref:carbohydrate binding domain-containing protein n=1 Tax=Clostridium chrysemydis TaxID=2665504 RepID=UPI003F2A0B1F